MNFEPYPFEKLNALFKNITPNGNYTPSALTIGEPQFETPDFIQESLKNSASLLKKYPKTSGEDFLKESMLKFVRTRFGVSLDKSELIPSFGTREVLFNFPQFFLFDKPNPTVAFPNPFYQIYEGAAIASRANIIHMPLTKQNDFQASLTPEQMEQTDLVILNYPSNPTSANMSVDDLASWVKNALKYDFVLLNDECYSEIYFDESTKSPSLLEASVQAGNDSFKNILVVNSISKRSSAPGLRSGFIAGDKQLLQSYMKYRTYIGCASPIPLQKAAATAWREEEHVQYFRSIYTKNFQLAKEILNITIPESTFYIWLEVKDDLAFAAKLYEEKNIKVLPGRFLGRDGVGQGYVRIALVENEEKTKEVLTRLKDFLDDA
jgi:aspartate/methionine/tyrosine aminotransferase